MTGAIAIIGWGSLLWDIENLAPHVTGDWAIDRGPLLPLEFVRVSTKRLDALTVVVDRDHGVDCATSFRLSRQADVDAAAANLAARERAPLEHIGFLSVGTSRHRSRLPEIVDRMAAWLAETGLDAAVWTDLPGNFRERTGRDFSIDAAVAYLNALPERSLIEAKRYIASAPAAVDTPLRRTLDGHDWWRAVTY